MDDVYAKIQRDHNIPTPDLPNMAKMQKKLVEYDFSKFNNLDKNMLASLEKMLSEDMPRLMALIPQEERQMVMEGDDLVKVGNKESSKAQFWGLRP